MEWQMKVVAQRDLDRELRPFLTARRVHRPSGGWLRTVRKQVKRNRKPDETRRRDWHFDTDNPDAFYDLDVNAEERVMPRGERERSFFR